MRRVRLTANHDNEPSRYRPGTQPATSLLASGGQPGKPVGSHDSFEISPCALGAGVRLQEPPEARPVARNQQVGQLVEEDVVDDVLGHALQSVREPDAAL